MKIYSPRGVGSIERARDTVLQKMASMHVAHVPPQDLMGLRTTRTHDSEILVDGCFVLHTDHEKGLPLGFTTSGTNTDMSNVKVNLDRVYAGMPLGYKQPQGRYL